MNKVILMGRLTADPEIRYNSRTGEPVAGYTLAVDRGENAADFIRCAAFQKQAEFAEKYLKKGTKILIEGAIRTGSYTNRDGQKVHTTDVYVNRHEFAEGRTDEGEHREEAPPPPSEGTGFMDIPDGTEEGLPFN